LGLRRRKWQETGENYVVRSVIVFISHEILVHHIKEDEMGGARAEVSE